MPALSLRSLRPACLVLGAGLVAYAGCSSSGNAGVSVTHPTMIEVSPANFLGGVPCVSAGPGLKTYVATLYDRNETVNGGASSGGASGEDAGSEGSDATTLAFERLRGDTPSDQFELPSSAPAPCNASVGFGYVVPGRLYDVLIEGYEEPREEVQPRALGSHLLVASSNPTGPVLTSIYRAYCARAIPVNATVVLADECTPFDHEGMNGAPSLRVPLGGLLGELACGTEPGQVEKLRVTVSVGSVSDEQVLDCAPNAEAIFEDLEVGVASIYVAALSASGADVGIGGAGGGDVGGADVGGAAVGGGAATGGAEPSLGGAGGAGPIDVSSGVIAGVTCDARLVLGERATARCGRLTSVGTLRVDLVAALEELGLSCSADSVSEVDVLVDGAPKSFPPPACLRPFEAGFPPGPLPENSVVVRATPAGGDPVTAPCSAQIEPGKFNLASCKRDP